MTIRKPSVLSGSVGVAVLIAVSLTAYFAAAEKKPFDFGGEGRALVFLTTDKPMYRPGETVYIRGLTIDSATNLVLTKSYPAMFEVRSPKGDKVTESYTRLDNGIGGFRWKIPKGINGGEYKLMAKFPWTGFAPAEVIFDIRAYRVPRLRMQLEFLRKGYGPGEEVTATLEVTRAEGGIPTGANVTIVARLDGGEIHRTQAKVDDKGFCTARFRLPEKIRAGFGTLAMIVRDGGVQETAVKTIPVLLNFVDVRFYPEGGDLVQGQKTRLYLEARDLRKKPADVSGRILDSKGEVVASFATDHEGRGRTTFTPAKGEAYIAVLDKPAGNTQRLTLPKVRDSGYTLGCTRNVYEPQATLAFSVAGTQDGKVKLGLYRLDKELASMHFDLETGVRHIVSFTLPDSAAGVLRATLFDPTGVPRAERLFFRRPSKAVSVRIKATPESATPRGLVKLHIEALDAEGNPTPAHLFITAVDDAVLEKVERRERAPRLPVKILLGYEVRELADPDAYLGTGDEPARNLDLLLGTQGWRRFAFSSPRAFIEKHTDAAKRCIALKTPTRRRNGGRFGRGAPKGGGPPMAGAAPGAAEAEGKDKADKEVPDEEAGKVAPEKQEEDRKAPPPAPPAPKDGPAPTPTPAAKPTPTPTPTPAPAPRMAREKMKKMRRRMLPVIREYAHRAAPLAPGAPRSDFTETVYWNAGVFAKDGKTTVEFNLSDSITSFRVMVDALGAKGGMGSGDLLVESRRPFFVEPKLPLHLSAGDLAMIPVTVANATDTGFTATIETKVGPGLTLEGANPTLVLKPNSSGRIFLVAAADRFRGEVPVTIFGRGAGHVDRVMRNIPVFPAGFPMEIAVGGMIEKSFVFKAVLPEKMEAGSLLTSVQVYPSPLANLTDALKRLLREPHGCFEQTSSTNYPNVMAMQYFQSHHVRNAEIAVKVRNHLDRGYKKLVGFECSKRGYEWFGRGAGHEALTAYGLMEFVDMAKVYPVDNTMMQRTRTWLLDRRDGEGGFKRNPRALDSFGRAPAGVTNAYITWTLVESGQKDIDREVAAVKKTALEGKDSYIMALGANILLLRKDPDAEKILLRLGAAQTDEGFVGGAATTVTRSGGNSLHVETTSLTVVAWLRSGKHPAQVEKATRWLLKQCKGGRFGSTQATILALKAIVAYDKSRGRPKNPGTLSVYVNKEKVGSVSFPAGAEEPIALPSFVDRLKAGENLVEIRMEGGAEMPFGATIHYNAMTPADSPECKVRLRTELSSPVIKEGEAAELNVWMRNTTNEGLPMTVAIVGIPGGLDVNHDRLKELVKQGTIAAYETRLRDVVLYKRCMRPGETVHAVLTVVASIPGRYRGASSRSYLYYTDEHVHWNKGLEVKIEAKK